MSLQAPAASRELDTRAVDNALRRLARAESEPFLHAEAARRMAERLSVIRLKPDSLVNWWAFTGASSALLEAAYPSARQLIVEPSAALLERSRAATQRPWWSPRRWAGAEVELRLETDVPREPVQMVWANMMLHAAPDPPALFERWHEMLQTDGFVMFSCLGPGSLIELRRLYSRLGWPSPTPDFVDMHDLGDMLVRAGFADPVLDQETLTVHWADPNLLLEELRSLGGNADPRRFAGLRTPRWRDRLLIELGSLVGEDGRLRLSFELAYGHAFRAGPRVRADAPTRISLQEMRSMVRGSGNLMRPRDNPQLTQR